MRLLVPIKGGLGIGANAYLFTRDSHYELIDAANGLERHRDVDQRNPQVRVYRARSSVRGGGRSAGASNRGEGSTSVAARMLTALIGICNGGSRE